MKKKSLLSIKLNSENPCCDHGPSILYETKGDKYYGCAAFRDSKMCNFRIKENDIIKKRKNIIIKRKTHISVKLQDFLSLDKSNRFYCHDCNKLFVHENNEESVNEICFKRKHKLSSNVSKSDVYFPTRFLNAATNNKANAQYFFSEEFLKYLLVTCKSLSLDKIICVGTPRLHETILDAKRNGNIDISSFLLDIDERLMQFHEKSFGLYNMFNNYFLIEDHMTKLAHFLESKDRKNVLLFCDPPFGGLLELLSMSLNAIQKFAESHNCIVNKMVILPYFLGKKLNEFNSLKMLDYRVIYDNHKRMNKSDLTGKGCQGNRRESVVRIFTDYEEKNVKPPNADKYQFCSICQRFSHVDNKHCNKCNKCPTRHGPRYVHCDLCGKCRQPTKKHCNRCGFCNTAQHQCSENNNNK